MHVLLKSRLIVLATVCNAAQGFPQSDGGKMCLTELFSVNFFFSLVESHDGLWNVVPLSEQLVRRWLAIGENFCWHLWQPKAATRSSSSATVTHCRIMLHQKKRKRRLVSTPTPGATSLTLYHYVHDCYQDGIGLNAELEDWRLYVPQFECVMETQ